MQPDLAYTQRLLNYTQASYQGRFAMLNILAQTDQPLFRQSELEKTQKILKELHVLEQQLLNDTLQFAVASINNPSGAHKRVRECLQALQAELESIAKKVRAISLSESALRTKEDMTLLLATFGRYAYAKDNYVRGNVRFAEAIQDESLKENYQLLLSDAKQTVEIVTQYLTQYREQGGSLEYAEIRYLLFLTRTLPGTFRSNVHDIHQLLIGPHQQLQFSHAQFLAVEAQVWQQAGYSALEAGYWRAQGLSLEEALAWQQLDLNDPALVAQWHTAGFAPDAAKVWLEVLFNPEMALRWGNAGFTPRDAAVLAMNGFAYPEDLPAEDIDALLTEAHTAFTKPPQSTEDPGNTPTASEDEAA